MNNAAPTASSNDAESSSTNLPPKKSRGGLKLATLALASFSLGLGYAAFSSDTDRKQIESYIPQTRYLFDYIDELKSSLPTFAGKATTSQ